MWKGSLAQVSANMQDVPRKRHQYIKYKIFLEAKGSSAGVRHLPSHNFQPEKVYDVIKFPHLMSYIYDREKVHGRQLKIKGALIG